MSRGFKRIDELDIELVRSSNLLEFCQNLNRLCRDLSWMVDYQSDMLKANLATRPPVDARFGRLSARARARAVAWCLKAAAEAIRFAGSNSVKTWSLFLQYYQPTVYAEEKTKKPKFELDNVN